MNYVNTMLIIVAIGIVTYFMHRIVNTLRGKQDKEVKDPYTLKEAAVYDVQINRLIYSIKTKTNADKVCLARFHNGGHFANGMDMKKFSVTHETPFGSTEPVMDRCQAMLNSRYPDAFLQLVTLGEYIVNNVEDCTDPNFRHDMKKYGFTSTRLFLIKQFDGSDEGFVGINFIRSKVMSPEEIEHVTEAIPTLIGLVNFCHQEEKFAN